MIGETDGKASRNSKERVTFCFGIALQACVRQPGGDVQEQVDEVWRRYNLGIVNL